MGEIRAPVSEDYPDLELKVIMTPSITPMFTNNPGYTILEVDKESFSFKIEWNFLQFQELGIFRVENFVTYNPEELYDFDPNNAT